MGHQSVRLNSSSPLSSGFIGGHYFPASLHPFSVAYPYSTFETATLLSGASRVADGVETTGNNQAIRIGALDGLQTNQEIWTLAFRWRWTNTPSNFYYWLYGEGFNQTSINANSAGVATTAYAFKATNGFDLQSSFNDGTWLTWIWTAQYNTDTNNHRIWQHGIEQVNDTSSTTSNTKYTGSLYIGRDDSTGRWSGGITQWVYAWNRLLKPAERRALALRPEQVIRRPLRPTYSFFEPSAGAPINQTVAPASVPIVGQSVGFTLETQQTVSPAAVPIVGQSVGFSLGTSQTVSPAALPITGQSVGFGLTVDQTVSPGALPIAGQSVGFTLTTGIQQTVNPAAIPLVGQSIGFDLTIDQTVSPAALPLVGQTVTFTTGITQEVSPAAVPLAGQSVGFDLTIDQTVSPAAVPITGQNLGQVISGALAQTVTPGSLTITGQTLTLVLKSIQGTLLDDIEEDLGATFFECSGLGFATDFVHSGTTYCGIFTAEATDISERRNAFIETETTNTASMSRGDVIEVIATPLNSGGTFTIRGISPDGTGQTTIVLDNVA